MRMLCRVHAFPVHHVDEMAQIRNRLNRPTHTVETVLQIRVGNMDNLGIVFSLFLHRNMCCDPSLEPSRLDGSNEGLQRKFH